MKIARGKCKHCGQVKVEIQTPNHILHLLMAVATGGLWLIVWLLQGSAVRCSQCGRKATKNFFG